MSEEARPAFEFPCHACGEPAVSDTYPDEIAYRCNSCGQRVVCGTVVGRWVIEPERGGFVRVTVTVGEDVREYRVDPLLAIGLAQNLLSVASPPVE